MKNLQPQLRSLQQLSIANKLPHAWLFSGGTIAAKLEATQEFSQWLLCTNKHNSYATACGNCKSCHLFVAQTHPDVKIISPAADKTTIVIDAVRELTEFVVAKPQLNQHKIVIIHPAEALQQQAANALLKNLEEPPGNTIFFLLAQHAALLLKTIVSRCSQLDFVIPSLQATANAETTQLFNDLQRLWVLKNATSIQLVDLWIKRWANEVLYWLELVLADLIRFKYTQDVALLRHRPEYTELVAINKAVTAQQLWCMLQRLQQAQYWFGRGHKPNLQLIMEDILGGTYG